MKFSKKKTIQHVAQAPEVNFGKFSSMLKMGIGRIKYINEFFENKFLKKCKFYKSRDGKYREINNF